MEPNELMKWNIARHIMPNGKFNELILSVEDIPRSSNIMYERTQVQVNHDMKMYQCGILDFEGYPVFLCGILLHNTIFSFYIKDYIHRFDFYTLIFDILKVLENLVFFTFGTYERDQLMKLRNYLQVQGYDISKYTFLDSLPIINMQKERSESLTEALHYINYNSPQLSGDPLLRDNKLINKLFFAQKFKEIIAHNRNCLINEKIIFEKRWLKQYLI